MLRRPYLRFEGWALGEVSHGTEPALARRTVRVPSVSQRGGDRPASDPAGKMVCTIALLW